MYGSKVLGSIKHELPFIIAFPFLFVASLFGLTSDNTSTIVSKMFDIIYKTSFILFNIPIKILNYFKEKCDELIRYKSKNIILNFFIYCLLLLRNVVLVNSIWIVQSLFFIARSVTLFLVNIATIIVRGVGVGCLLFLNLFNKNNDFLNTCLDTWKNYFKNAIKSLKTNVLNFCKAVWNLLCVVPLSTGLNIVSCVSQMFSGYIQKSTQAYIEENLYQEYDTSHSTNYISSKNGTLQNETVELKDDSYWFYFEKYTTHYFNKAKYFGDNCTRIYHLNDSISDEERELTKLELKILNNKIK